MKQATLRHTAFHEAGHVVAALHFHIRVGRVTIEPAGWQLGSVRHGQLVKWETADLHQVERGIRQIIVALAGGWAEHLSTGRYRHISVGADNERAADLALTLCDGESAEASALLKYATLRTRRLVRSDAWQGPIRAIAARLLEKPTLTGAEAKVVFDRTLR